MIRLSLTSQCAMAPTIAAAHLFATARLFVTGRIFIEAERILVKREATWFDKTFSLDTICQERH